MALVEMLGVSLYNLPSRIARRMYPDASSDPRKLPVDGSVAGAGRAGKRLARLDD